jgi:hypothetical protein
LSWFGKLEWLRFFLIVTTSSHFSRRDCLMKPGGLSLVPRLSLRPSLLHDVREFMSKQQLTGGSGQGLVGAKYDIRSNGIRERIDRVGRLRCQCVAMQPYVSEVRAKPRFKEGAGLDIEGLAGAAEDIVNDRRSFIVELHGSVCFGPNFRLFFFLTGGAAFSGEPVGGRGKREIWCGRTHDVFGNVVGFGFEGVVHRADCEFALEGKEA